MWSRPLTLGGAVLVVLFAAWLFSGGYNTLIGGSQTIDTDAMAIDIETSLEAKGLTNVKLDCSPVDGAVKQGDQTVCSGSAKDAPELSVLVTFNSDGSYIWRVQ